MKKYTFELLEHSIPGFRERDHIIPAESLTDAIRKFTRKHELEAPAYWDEPFFETFIEMRFTCADGAIHYRIQW